MAEIANVLDLKPHPQVKHFAPELPDSIYKELKSDIGQRGVQDPLQICNNVIICGHNRHRAAKELGLKSVPVIRKDDLNPAQQILHAVKDNILRRQMTDDQRALQYTVPEVKKAFEIEAKERKREGGAKGGKAAPGAGRGKKKAHKDEPEVAQACEREPQARDLLADAAGTTRRKIENASVLWEREPQKAEEILSHGETESGESLGRVAGEIKRKDRANETQNKLEKGLEEFEEIFKLQRFDVWNIRELDPGFGKPWPGNIPASLVANVLYYFTGQGALVVDPMAGGGVTGDVCKALGRKFIMADINPSGPQIKKHDIGEGPIPGTEGKADLIFLDPPYWTLKDSEYTKEGASSMNWADWCNWLISLAAATSGMLKPDGYAAALMQDNLTKDVGGGRWSTPSTLELHKAFENAGLIFQIEISVPLSTQQVSAREMEWAKLNRKILGIRRSLLVYQKK